MGNQNCKDCPKSIFFAEEDVDDMMEWMSYTKSIEWSYPSYCFPGTELMPVQPYYNTLDDKTQNNIQRRSVLLVNKDYRKNRGLVRKSRHKLKSLREENDPEGNINNNVIKEKLIEEMRYEKREEEDGDKEEKTGFPAGRVYIAMSHDPITSRLKVAVIKAKNLTCKQDEGKDLCGVNRTASSITVSLVQGDRVIDSYSTAVKTGYSEVLYYENYAFNLNQLNLRGLSVVISAKHSCKKRFMKHSHVIGSVVLHGLLVKDSNAFRDGHLIDVTTRPRQTLYKWHTLTR